MVNGRKTVHIEKELHKALELYKTEKELSSLREATRKIILAGFEAKKEEIPDYIIEKLPSGKSVKRESDQSEYIDISDLGKETTDLSKELEGGEVGSEQTIKNITLSCMRYLKNHEEGTRKDFEKEVYPEFEEDFKEDSFWKVAKYGLQQIEELGGPVETPKGRGHSRYLWRG